MDGCRPYSTRLLFKLKLYSIINKLTKTAVMENTEKKQKFELNKRIGSFKYAFAGIRNLILTEHNSRIHLFAGFIAILAGFLLRIDVVGWITVIFAIGLVFTAELINSALEKLVDLISPEHNELAGKIKDFAAAAVLFSALTALAGGLIVFLPRLIDVIKCLK